MRSRVAGELRLARTCYDHLAGKVGVRLAAAVTGAGLLAEHDGSYVLGANGVARLAAFGLDLPALQASRRAFAKPCLDWSERRHHVAGAVGAALLARMMELGWLDRRPGSRAVRVHDAGRRGLIEVFGCDLADLDVGQPARVTVNI